MTPHTEDGVSGFQGCNLNEINGGAINTKEDFYRACRVSAILGTLQAGYTNFRYVNKVNKEIFEREALLGCSITGWMNSPDILFDEQVLKKGAEIVLAVNSEMAKLLGIREAARTCCVKPSGNASVLLQTASGIHGEHAPRYFRNMQVNKEEDIGKYFAKLNPAAVEESVWSAGKTDWVFSLPVVAKAGSIFKSDLLGVKQLEYVKKVQNTWVEYGTRPELCVNNKARHNVSNTISVDNWDEVANYIYDNMKSFAGVSLLSSSGDRDYPQAPFQEVFTPEQLLSMYGVASMFASGLVVDALHAFPSGLWDACSAIQNNFGETTSDNVLKRDWVRRCIKFADNYFDGDTTKATYCLKDIYNLHRWNKIEQTLVDIDWSKFDFTPKYEEVDTLGAVACSGGVCELVNL
jgi:ribonucleoside-diphosphate reductase alpha chain